MFSILIDYGSGYMTLTVYWKSQNCIPKEVHLSKKGETKYFKTVN